MQSDTIMKTFARRFAFIALISVIHAENYCDTGLRAPDNSTDPNECCPSPQFLPMDIVMECRNTYMEMQTKKNEQPGLPRGCCVGDCILEKMGFNPKGDGNIDLPGLKGFLMNATNIEAAWIETMANSINTCYAMAEARAEDFKSGYAAKPAFEGEKMCHPISGRVLSCITNEKFINCPTSVWKGTDDCIGIRTFVQQCEIPTKQA